MSWEKARKLGADLAKDVSQYENFAKGGKYALYGTGRIGVTVAKIATTGGLITVIKDAPNQLKKSLDDIASLLDKAGKFVDAVLEADYQKYVARKSALGKSVRERLDWKQIRDYWLNDSPMARGNAFNRKAVIEQWYDYNEVTLENGKRLGGYTPPKNGQAGMIISRKATDLDDIEFTTFENYLKEAQNKYATGSKINAPKYGDELKGKVLEGDIYLEIPASNTTSSRIQEYSNLAKSKYDITIIFRPG